MTDTPSWEGASCEWDRVRTVTRCPSRARWPERWNTTDPIPPARRVLPAEHGDVHGMRASSLAFEGMVPEPPRSLHPRTSVAKDVTSERLPVSVTVLLPTRNEEEAIGMTLDAIPRDWCEELEILIVDGSSTDRTRELALGAGLESTSSRDGGMGVRIGPGSRWRRGTSS